MLQKIKRDENIVYLKRFINGLLLGLLIFMLIKGIIVHTNGFPFFRFYLLSIIAIFCHLTLKKLYYTYWTFGLIFFALILIDVLTAFWMKPWLGIMGLLLLIAFLIVNYFLASPIYYPRVNWWEYDFRYRTDLKGKIILEDGTLIECRIADIRRKAACVHSFANFQTGSEFNLEIDLADKAVKSTVKIISNRQGIPGRPSIYGVQFPQNAFPIYQEIRRFWKQTAQLKNEHKFKKVLNG
ncbi:MAG: hypothetical protein HYV97_14175 [Bdellovibrio sp.]|nr:hypothetical protein [Bdellovibrio sp.]